MKKLRIISCLLLIFTTLLVSSVLAASSEEYIITKELVYESTRTIPLSSGFVEVLVGQTNFVQYQKDINIKITPTPSEIREDEYGNLYAYFDLKGLRAGQKYKITVTRDVEVSTYDIVIPSRTNSVINEETKPYLVASERIESDDPELIAKAKEITENETTDYKRAQAIFEYINVNMAYDESSAYANKGSLSAFNSMKGVCEEFATLYVAMCRAVGIPARALEGYKVEDKLSGDTVIGKTLVNHVWTEIFLEDYGWVPVEPTVIYMINGERRPYLDSFTTLKSPEHVAVGIYNYEKANRRMQNVIESSYEENVVLKKDIPVEVQNSFGDLTGYEWASNDIQSLYAKNVILGYSDTEYKPSNSISRIEFIAMLSRLLRFYDTQAAVGGSVYYYPDYDENHWSKGDYDYLLRCYNVLVPSDIVSMGFDAITDVFGVGSLQMNKAITRAEAVALMDLFLDNVSGNISFTDVNYTTKFRSSIQKAYTNGLIIGYPDGSFRPSNPISRAEMAVILNRYIEERIYSL